jgi:hypothetical protein
MDKRLINKICKTCLTPTEYFWEHIDDASLEADIHRMKEYVNCVRRVERQVELHKKNDSKTKR